MTLANWQPSNRMHLYISKDIVAQMWNAAWRRPRRRSKADPYAKGKDNPAAHPGGGGSGNGPDAFNAPRMMAFAPDRMLSVAVPSNNRRQHLNAVAAS